MDDLNPQVIKGFGRHFKGYSKLKGIYLCNTDKGIKQVKKVNIPKDKIIFQHTAKEMLYNKGFKNIDRFCISIDNTPYYIFNNSVYTMSDYIDGVECDLSKNLKEAVEELAVMHKIAVGLPKYNPSQNLNELYKKRLIEMGRLKKKILNSSNFTNLDIMILKNYDYYYNQCKEAICMIEASNYKNFMELVKAKGILCHNNYREENIIINVNGVYITNFESCNCDIQIVDLVNIIRRYLKKSYFDEVEAYKLLEVYNKIKPLDNEELKIITAMITFPYKFLKICNLYYNKRRSWIQNGMIYSLELYLSTKEKNQKLLKLLKNVI